MTIDQSEASRLQERDREILDALVHRIRVLSIPQIARTWWSHDAQQEASRRLRALSNSGYLSIFTAMSHPEIALTGPVISWHPGQDAPNFGANSYKLKSRWILAPVPMQFVIASRFAGRALGGNGGRFPRESEITHDLHMGAVFLRYRVTARDSIRFWQSESSILRDRGGSKKEKLPDAILQIPGEPQIVEFGGAYSKKKLERFHHYCAELPMAYEVW